MRTFCIDKEAFQSDRCSRTCTCTWPSTDPKTTSCLSFRFLKSCKMQIIRSRGRGGVEREKQEKGCMHARPLTSLTLKPLRLGSHHSPTSSGLNGMYRNLRQLHFPSVQAPPATPLWFACAARECPQKHLRANRRIKRAANVFKAMCHVVLFYSQRRRSDPSTEVGVRFICLAAKYCVDTSGSSSIRGLPFPQKQLSGALRSVDQSMMFVIEPTERFNKRLSPARSQRTTNLTAS